MAKTILIIDDEASILDALSGILSDEGFTPLTAPSGEEGLALLAREPVDLVLLDIWMQGMDGLETLEKIRADQPHLPVIMISGHGTIETAVAATRKGAFDFIEKPLSYDKVVLSIKNGLLISRLEEDNLLLREQGKKTGLSGTSAAMTQLRQMVERVAPSDSWVLIRGEHGTGKEVVAQTIHRLSRTVTRPMVEVNCAAIPEELIESELFGHEKGSFTGAHSSRRGKFDQADGGILFLDEIGDMSLKAQAKVLRILQEQKFERVGGSRAVSVNVRVLAATNKDLEVEIEAGRFRADLFWRLNVVPLFVPPLRQRLEDIPALVTDFLGHHAARGLGEKTVSSQAMARLQTHLWPGNVRELKNFIERILIMWPEKTISLAAVESLLGPTPDAGAGPPSAPMATGVDDVYRLAKRDFEKNFLLAALKKNMGNIALTAKQIGMERSHLHKKIKGLGIELDE